MSIASLLPFGVSLANQFLSSTVGQAQSASSSSSSSTAASAFTLAAPSTATTNATVTGGTTSTISDQVLRMLVMMQNQPAAGAAATQNSTGTSQNPLSQLFSAIDTTGSGAISQSQLQAFVEGKGGTQAEANALYSGLTQDGKESLTEQQLTSDMQSGASQGTHSHHHHGGWSAPQSGRAGAATASNATSSTPQGSSGQSASGQSSGGGNSALLSLLSSLTQATPAA